MESEEGVSEERKERIETEGTSIICRNKVRIRSLNRAPETAGPVGRRDAAEPRESFERV